MNQTLPSILLGAIIHYIYDYITSLHYSTCTYSDTLRETDSIVKNRYSRIFQKNVTADICMTQTVVKDALDKLRGAVMIVYPMGLPPHDPIRNEFENNEDLSGTQVSELHS